MYLIRNSDGEEFRDLYLALVSVCIGKDCVTNCPLSSNHTPERFPPGIEPCGCMTLYEKYPELFAEYGGFELVLEPGDDGYVEDCSYSFEQDALNLLLGL